MGDGESPGLAGELQDLLEAAETGQDAVEPARAFATSSCRAPAKAASAVARRTSARP